MSRTTCGLAQIGLLVALVALAGCPTWNPALSVSPLALSFGTEGTENAFQIRNQGGGVLSWQLSTSESWMSFWQRVEDTSVVVEEGTTTGEVDTIEVRVARGSLSPGTHTGEIQVTSNVGNETIRVSVEVAAPATLNASPTSLDFGTAQTTDTFTLTNEGTQDVNWSLRVPPEAGWLTASPASGRLSPETPTEVEVQVDRAGRGAGTYQTDITVTAGSLTVTVHASMEVLARLLVVEPLELDFGTSGVERTFTVRNAGAETLNWQVATDDLEFPDYVTVSPSSGSTTTETDTVTVRVDRDAAGFAHGTRNEVPITVTSEENGGTAVVTLVISVGAFSVSPAELDFGTDSNQETLTFQNQGNAAVNWTTSEESAWITQVTPSGTAPVGGTSDITVTVDRTGLAPGDYQAVVTVQSTDQTESVPVSLTIPSPPRLVATPSSLDFRTDQMDKVVAIWNDGSGTVNWSLDATPTEFPSWLSALFNGVSTETQHVLQGALTGQQTDSLRFSVDRSTLAPGTQTASIIITATDQEGNALESRTIAVAMSVAAQPVLGVDTGGEAGQLTFGTETTSLPMTLANLGTGTLTWSIDAEALPPWLAITPPLSGVIEGNSRTQELTVSVDRMGIDSGDHAHELVVASNGGEATVHVVMTVPEPVLRLAPESLSFGENETTATFTIVNGGGSTLEWSLSIPEGVTWFSAAHRDTDATSGTTLSGEEEVISVTVNRQGQQSGDHNSELLINSNGGNKTLPITMTVPGPRLSVSPQTLVFTPAEVQKTLTVQNAGDVSRTLIWSIDEGYPHWLSFNMERGAVTTQPNVLEVTANASGLTAGVHEGDVSFASNGGSATVHVSMEVPRFTLSPETVEIGGRATTAVFLVENHADASLDWTASPAWASWNTPVADWLEVIPSSGTIPINARATLTVRVISRDNLVPGWYEGPITVQEDTVTGIEESLHVRVRVPAFSVGDPRTLDFGVVEAAVSDTFAVNNNGATPVDWTATVSSGASWLTLNEYSGHVVDSQTVTVTVNPAGLSPGAYAGTITVTSGEDTDTVTVQMTAPAPPTLAAAPISIDFGSATTDRLLAIWNSGVGTVNWRIDTTSASPAWPGWLSLSPVTGGVAQGSVSGSETDTVTVTVNRDGLAPSTTPYPHAFVITATDDGGAPLDSLTISVEMTVVGIPSIEVDTTDGVDQMGVPFVNLGTTLTQATFTIRNVGTGMLTWSIATAGFPAWLTISSSQGSIAPGRQTSVTLTADRTGLGPGPYTPWFVVASNDPENRAAQVNVQMVIPERVIIGWKPLTIDFDQVTSSSYFEVANMGDPGTVLDFVIKTNKEWVFFSPERGQSIGTNSDLKDWQMIDVSIDRTKLEGPGSTGEITIHAYEHGENGADVLLDEVVDVGTVQVSVVAAPLSFEVAAAMTRVPSLVRIPMLMRNLRYQVIPLLADQLDTYADSFTVFENYVPIDATETNQFLKDGSRLRTDVVILLDYSGSVFESAQLIEGDPAFDEFAVNHPGAPPDKLQAIYEYYIGRLILQLPDYYRIAILEFHERSNPVVPRPNLVYRFTTNKVELLDQLRSISVQDHGASELVTEMISASSFLANADSPYVPIHDTETSAYYVPFETADVSALILVSDGRETTPPYKIKEAIDSLSGRRTRLFAIGWGKDVDHEPLVRVASATGGHYYPTRTVPLTDENDNPVYDQQGNPILRPTTTELAEYCFSEEPCTQSIARDLQSHVVFSYVSLNEQPGGAKMRIAAAFDDPNDNEDACELADQRVIAGSFTQTVDFSGFAGDVNLGQISMHTDGIQPDSSAEVILRADYIPRNIRVFEFEVWTTEPFTLSRVGPDDGGLVWSWNVQQWNTGASDWGLPLGPLAEPDQVPSAAQPGTGNPWLRLRVSSPDDTPLVYGEFGELFKLTFSAVGGPFTLNLSVDNDPYLDADKYFIYPNAIEVNEDGRRAPSFPTPLLTRISPVHGDDVLNTFHLGTGDNSLEFSIMNIGGTFPYLPEEPVVMLNWKIGDLPTFLKVPQGGLDEGILRGGVGDTDTVRLEVDRDLEPGSYYGTIGVEYSHFYGLGVAGINVWLDILPPGIGVTDETGAPITEVDFGDALDEGGFYVVNTGQSTLSWTISMLDDAGAPVDELPDWITVSKTSGTVKWSDPDPPYDPTDYPETVQIQIDRETAPEGPFLYTFVVTGMDERLEPVLPPSTFDVEVRGNILPPELRVTGSPWLPLDFGTSETQMAINVANIGNRVLYWEVNAAAPPAWLSIIPVNGTISYGDLATPVAVRVNRTTAPASFSYTFQVFGRDTDASGAPVEPLAGVDVAISGTNPP